MKAALRQLPWKLIKIRYMPDYSVAGWEVSEPLDPVVQK